MKHLLIIFSLLLTSVSWSKKYSYDNLHTFYKIWLDTQSLSLGNISGCLHNARDANNIEALKKWEKVFDNTFKDSADLFMILDLVQSVLHKENPDEVIYFGSDYSITNSKIFKERYNIFYNNPDCFNFETPSPYSAAKRFSSFMNYYEDISNILIEFSKKHEPETIVLLNNLKKFNTPLYNFLISRF